MSDKAKKCQKYIYPFKGFERGRRNMNNTQLEKVLSFSLIKDIENGG